MKCKCDGTRLFIGSTPVHCYTFPVADYDLEKVQVTYAQDGQIIFEKTKEDLEFGEPYVDDHEVWYYPATLKLSQQDTYLFDGRKNKYCMQVKAKTYLGEVMESPIQYYNIEAALNKEVL